MMTLVQVNDEHEELEPLAGFMLRSAGIWFCGLSASFEEFLPNLLTANIFHSTGLLPFHLEIQKGVLHQV